MRTNHSGAAVSRMASGMTAALLLASCSSSDSAIEAQPDALAVGEGGTVTRTASGAANLLANDVGLSTSAVVTSTPLVAPQSGTLELSPDGTFRYTHDGGEAVQDTFRYEVVDGGKTAWADVQIDIDPEDDPPVARNDLYSNVVGNTWLAVGRTAGTAVAVLETGSLLDNDFDPDGVLQVTESDTTSAQGGRVLVEPDGRFRYLPPPGFNGTDTFDYEVSDGLDTATATVTLEVQETVWYVDNAATEAGDGTAGMPLRDFSELTTLLNGLPGFPGSDVNVYLRGDTGGGTYTGPLVVQAGLKVFGSGAAFQLRGIDLAASAPPLIETTVASTNGVEFTGGGEVHGVEIGDTTGVGVIANPTLGGGSGGDVMLREVIFSGQGDAISFLDADLDVQVQSITCLGSTGTAIDIEDCEGSFLVTGETVVNTVQPAISIFGNRGGTGVAVTFTGLTTLVGNDIPSLLIQETSANVVFGDLAIPSPNNQPIRIQEITAPVTFADVDIMNPNVVAGHAVVLDTIDDEVRFASLDVDGAGSFTGVLDLSVQSSDGGVVISGEGSQGDGGTQSDFAGTAYTLASGSIVMVGVTASGIDGSILDAQSYSGTYGFAECRFSDWARTSTTMPGIQLRLQDDSQLILASNEFDATGITTDEAALAVETTSGSVRCLIGGGDETDPRKFGNDFTGLTTRAIQFIAAGTALELDVVGGSIEFDTVSSPTNGDAAVVVTTSIITGVSLGMRGVKVTGPGYGALTVVQAAGPPVVTNAPFAADIRDNELTDTLAAFYFDLVNTGEARIALRDNVATGLDQFATYVDMPAKAVVAPSQLLIERESYAFRDDPTGAALPVIGLDSEADAYVRISGVTVTGAEELSQEVVGIAFDNPAATVSHVSIEDNTFRNDAGTALQMATVGSGLVMAEIRGHASGAFELEQGLLGSPVAELQLEEATTFTSINPGATLAVTGGVIVPIAVHSVQLPDGPWR